MTDMKLIMENWRSYQEQDLLIEACEGSACLEEYKIQDFLDDVGSYTGIVQKLILQIERKMAENPHDTQLQATGKKVTKILTRVGVGGAVGLGLGSMFGPGGSLAGLALGTTVGSTVGGMLGDLLPDVLKGGKSVIEKVFLDSQVEDPPDTPRGWVFDLNDALEKLVTGGEKDSFLYKEFKAELVKEFEKIEQQIQSVLDEELPEQARRQILQTPIKAYMTKGTVSQMLQNFIKQNELTKDVGVSHAAVR